MKILFKVEFSIAYIFLVFFILTLTSCARKIDFQISSVVPSARGYVQIKKDKNKNNIIALHLLNLAEVERLQSEKKTYVVWMLTNQNATINLGQINSSTTLFSKQLKASFETVSSFVPVQIYITAEQDSNAQYPDSQVVLSTENFKK